MAVDVDIFYQPAVQCFEASAAHLIGNLWKGFQGFTEELSCEDIPESVSLEVSADRPGKPVHILHHAVSVIWWNDAQVRPVALAPGFSQVTHRQGSFQQGDLEIEAQHDMQVVGDFVGFGADQCAGDFVYCPVKFIQCGVAQLLREGLLQERKTVFPKLAAAPHDILPQPGLALVQAG